MYDTVPEMVGYAMTQKCLTHGTVQVDCCYRMFAGLKILNPFSAVEMTIPGI